MSLLNSVRNWVKYNFAYSEVGPTVWPTFGQPLTQERKHLNPHTPTHTRTHYCSNQAHFMESLQRLALLWGCEVGPNTSGTHKNYAILFSHVHARWKHHEIHPSSHPGLAGRQYFAGFRIAIRVWIVGALCAAAS